MRYATRIVLLVLAIVLAAAPTYGTPQAEPPSLAIILAVDQLRADLLDRYDTLFVGGLRRLRDEGYRFTNATHDHAMTATAPGHTTLATGVYPSRHGIVGNSWSEFDGGAWRPVYSMEDLDQKILGYGELPGRSSRNITRQGLPDWLGQGNPEARVVSVSRKDRSAIGLAAKTVGEVYWLVPQQSGFVTSEFYHDAYPEWVSEFNSTTMPLIYSDTVWTSLVPPEGLPLTRPDTSAFESDGKDTYFPHRAAARMGSSEPAALNFWRATFTPFPDRAVVSFALAAVNELKLGQRGTLDYLGISLSQTDLVGHSFGPLSREQLDNLLRLDVELGRLFSALDDSVGAGHWVLAMSADHGVLGIPEQLASEGIEAGRLTPTEMGELRQHLQTVIDRLGEGEDPEDAVAAALQEQPFVAAVYPFSAVEGGAPADSFQVLFANSHSRTRVLAPAGRAGVHLRLKPNVIMGASRASHGSPYYYDRHVPLIFLGGPVQVGVSQERVATVDLAPTLAWLTGIATPGDLDGRVLNRVVRDHP
jgi:type I phosphodiesterase/nucleotide pyrophosphatase